MSEMENQDYLAIDITPFALVWQETPSENYGMVLELTDSILFSSLKFCSSDYLLDTTLRPQLIISYDLTSNTVEEVRVEIIELYPNPNQGSFTVKIQGEQARDITLLQVISLTGQIMFQEQIIPNAFSTGQAINLNHLRNGPYVLKLSGLGYQVVRRFQISN